MTRLTRIASAQAWLVALALAMTGAVNASAAEIVFDDALGTGWSIQWFTGTQGDTAYSGDTTLLAEGNQQVEVLHAGYTPAAGDEVLTFYINTLDGTEITNMRVLVNGSERNADEYVVDGTPNGGGYFSIDDDSDTWQKIEWDSSQWATDTPITMINFNRHWSGSGDAQGTMIIDEVYFGVIPEPASLAMLGLGGLLMIGRRRA